MNETPENSVPTPLQPVPASLRPEWRPPAPARGLSAPRLCRDSVLTPAARQPPEAYDVQSFLPWFDSCSLPRTEPEPYVCLSQADGDHRRRLDRHPAGV